MKRYLLTTIAILAVALLFAGCSSSGGGDDDGTRVNKPTSSALSSYEGTTPATDDEAKTLFSNAVNAATLAIESDTSAAASGELSASATDTFNETFSGTIDGNPSGTIDLAGSVTGSFTEQYPTNYPTNQEGDYLFDVTMDLVFGADFNSFAFNDNGTDYVLDGILEVNSDINWNLQATVTSSSATGSYNYDYGFGLVYALTVDDTTNGQGGKFVLYVNEAFADSGDLSDAQSFDAVNPSFDATLELYNNNDELVTTITLTQSEVLDLFPFVGDFMYV